MKDAVTPDMRLPVLPPAKGRRKARPAAASETDPLDVDADRPDGDRGEVVILGEESAERETPPATDGLTTQVKQPLTIAFLLALVSGIAAEFLGSVYVPAGVMVAYFVFGILIPKTSRNSEQFADSLYYLGFILTLGALFLAMAPGLQASEISSQNIIEKFGIAILTTFIGMSLRIILLQLRYTSTDQEEEARESISHHVASLQKELGETLNEVRKFRRETFESATDSASAFSKKMEEIAFKADSAISSSREAMLNNLQAITRRIEESIQDVVGRLDKLDVPTDMITARLQAASSLLSKEMEELRVSISESATSFTASLAGSVAAIGRIRSDMESLDQAVSSVNDSVGQVAKLTASSNKEFADAASVAGQSMQSFRQNAQALAQVLHEVQQRLNVRGHEYEAGIAEAAAKIHSAAQNVTEDARGFTAALTTSAKGIRDALTEVKRNERMD